MVVIGKSIAPPLSSKPAGADLFNDTIILAVLEMLPVRRATREAT